MSSGALLLLLLSATPSLQLDWRGAPECPTRDAFLADVRRLRGEVREASGEGAILVEVTLSPGPTQWRARVATRTPRGEGRRELEADTCAEVVEAAAVVVSLALADPESSPAPAPLPALDPLPPEGKVALGLTGGFRLGPLPGVAPGASLAAVLTFGALRVEVAATTPFVQRVERSGAAAELAWWLSARLAGCYEFSLGRVALAPCVLVHGGWLAGRGLGGAATASGSGALAAVSAGAFSRVRLVSSLWLRLDASGGGALARPRFVTTTDGVRSTLAEAAPWLFDFNLGLEWRFE